MASLPAMLFVERHEFGLNALLGPACHEQTIYELPHAPGSGCLPECRCHLYPNDLLHGTDRFASIGVIQPTECRSACYDRNIVLWQEVRGWPVAMLSENNTQRTSENLAISATPNAH
jgi:hypothetical protein